jgi:hypothetical protein
MHEVNKFGDLFNSLQMQLRNLFGQKFDQFVVVASAMEASRSCWSYPIGPIEPRRVYRGPKLFQTYEQRLTSRHTKDYYLFYVTLLPTP